MAKRKGNNLGPAADEYGRIKAEIATLEKRLKELKKLFQAAGVHEVEGDLFRVVASEIDDKYAPDWEKIAKKFSPSRQMLAANQKVTKAAHTRLSVYGRTGEDL